VWHRVEQRAQAIAGLDAPEEEEPRAVGRGIGRPATVRLEERVVHTVRDDVPIGAEIARVRIHHRLAHRDRRRVTVEDPLQRAPKHAAAD